MTETSGPTLPVTPETLARFGKQFGPWSVVRELGRGGMGVVYLAIRADDEYRRSVAIKVANTTVADEEGLRYVRRERQFLANLDHPNVARLLDAGTTEDGLAYIVMEYVEGRRIDVYCEEHRLALPARLELFRAVCGAVHYAHQNLIIHRDIKPGNVLVTAAGAVKLLDFGIAKLLAHEEGREASATVTKMAFTPEYASPEQVRGQLLTTATDVYSLGLLLYEIVTGRRAQVVATDNPIDWLRVVTETEPALPSTAVRRQTAAAAARASADDRASKPEHEGLARRLRGDLDNIVMKALRKDPRERYASAEALSEDLRRHLVGLPVEARRPTLRYRGGRFIRRHPLGVSASVLALASILAFTAAIALQSRRIAREAARANREAQTAGQVSDFLVGLFEVSDPGVARGNTVTAREILDRGAARIENELGAEPLVQARLMGELGRVHQKLGLYERAEELLERALRATDDRVEASDPLRMRILHDLANTHWFQTRSQEAEAAYLQVVEGRTRSLGPNHPDTLAVRSDLASAYVRQERWREAEELSLAVLAAQPAAGSAETVAVSNLTEVYRNTGRLEQAETMASRLVALLQKANGVDHPDTLVAQGYLADVYREQGRLAEAESLLRSTLGAMQTVLGDDHPETVISHYNLALVHLRQGRLEEAEAGLRGVLTTDLSLIGEEHSLIAGDRRSLACVLLQRGRRDEALALLRDNVRHGHSPLPADDGFCPLLSTDTEVVELARTVPLATDGDAARN